MCGIVGAVANRDVLPLLLDGLQRLEYRGYDSAGVAVIESAGDIARQRAEGKVATLAQQLSDQPLTGHCGIAHTRWATHGKPSVSNAHPHFSTDTLAVVHNGIIENHASLKKTLQGKGYVFTSDTDTEVIVHLIHDALQQVAADDDDPVRTAIQKAIAHCEGAYGLAILSTTTPNTLYVVRSGSPLVIGCGEQENYIASDPLALLPLTQQFIYLEEGDLARITTTDIAIVDQQGEPVERDIHTSPANADQTSKGTYPHYMLKEIHEQAQVTIDALDDRIADNRVQPHTFGHETAALIQHIERIHIIACGTSYHAGMLARYWFEAHAGIPTQVEVASENRYRTCVVEPNTLFIALSQSGETADTLAALRQAKARGYCATLAICNVSASSLVRESDLCFMIRAGAEIGVAATKSFTAQLIALSLFTALLCDKQGRDDEAMQLIEALQQLPHHIEIALARDDDIQQISQEFVDSKHALFLGRGVSFPVAMEAALKLKEISYIHAESYPAGELKHGPLALVDDDMPIVVVAPNDELTAKLVSNVQEVQARGGQLFLFTDEALPWEENDRTRMIRLQNMPTFIKPIVYNVALQLLAYHVAVVKGTDVDQPRNLAKSVTVE